MTGRRTRDRSGTRGPRTFWRWLNNIKSPGTAALVAFALALILNALISPLLGLERTFGEAAFSSAAVAFGVWLGTLWRGGSASKT